MSIAKKLKDIKEDLEYFDEDLEKYEYIIDLGKSNATLADEHKIPENLVHGCTSQVWLVCEKKDDELFFYGTSDAIIVKGLVYIMLKIFSGEKLKDIQDVDMDIVQDIKLAQIVTPTRQNGIIGMLRKIKEYANSFERV